MSAVRRIRRTSETSVGVLFDVLRAKFELANSLSPDFPIEQFDGTSFSAGIDNGMSGAAS